MAATTAHELTAPAAGGAVDAGVDAGEAREGAAAGGVAEGAAAGEVDAFVDALQAADRWLARAVALAGRLAGSGIAEREVGLPVELVAALEARLTRADARMVVTAGEVLADLPTVAGLFADGQVSWGQVRAIVCATKSLTRANRGLIDERVAATVAAHEPGAAAFDPDQLVWAVDAAVDELRPSAAERAERRHTEATFLARQLGFDGRMRVYGEFDAMSAAALNTALDAKAGRPPAGAGQPGRDPGYPTPADTDDSDSAGTDGSGGDRGSEHTGDGSADAGAAAGGDAGVGAGRWTATSKARQDADALVGICADWLGGDTNRPARPLLVACVDLSQTATTPQGSVQLGVRGPLPRIAAATLERLSHDADLRAVLFDGARPLAASDKLALDDLPDKIRFAVGVRDQGCRWPGSQDPLAHTDIDHTHDRAKGGDHHPDALASLSRRFHTLRHHHDWTLTLTPETGMLTIARGSRRYHSMPNTARLAPALHPPPGSRRRRQTHTGTDPPGHARGDPPDPTIPF